MKDMSFEKWMATFDAALVREFGADSSCFPDWDYWGYWDSDVTVKEALQDWIEDQSENY
jgi:hypothetical protein